MNLLDRMKLPFRKNKEFLSALYDILGFYPHDLEIYRVAFSHKSLNSQPSAEGKSQGAKSGGKGTPRGKAKERRPGLSRRAERRGETSENVSHPINNERLEYLGDAVLEAVVSDILFRHFRYKREGFLTSTRSKIVQREALNRLAEQMGLEKLILAAQGTRMSHTNIGGNAFEALMGAIYLDRGYKHCHWFITNRIIGQYVDLDNVAQKEVNFKSKLLEWSQKNRINLSFKDSNGDRGFHTAVVIEGITIARGDGRSKKESQQQASKEALTRMRCEPKTYDNIFRAKEKRTAMEAEESFALPKIDELDEAQGRGKKQTKNAPVLEEKSKKSVSDAAYDTAYDEAATYEVIDTAPEPEPLTLAYCEEKGLPQPPEADELREADEKLRKKHQRNRGAKTMGDAVKGATKGATTPAEKAEKREAERLAEVERQRAKAERKRKAEKQQKAQPDDKQREKACHETKQEREVEQALIEEDNKALTPEVVEQLTSNLTDAIVDNDVEESIETAEMADMSREADLGNESLDVVNEALDVVNEVSYVVNEEADVAKKVESEVANEESEVTNEEVEVVNENPEIVNETSEIVSEAEATLSEAEAEAETALLDTPVVAAPEEEDLIIAKDITPVIEENDEAAEDYAEETPIAEEPEAMEAEEETETEETADFADEPEANEEVQTPEDEPQVSDEDEQSFDENEQAFDENDQAFGEDEQALGKETIDFTLDDMLFGDELPSVQDQPKTNRKRNHRRGSRRKGGDNKPKDEASKPKAEGGKPQAAGNKPKAEGGKPKQGKPHNNQSREKQPRKPQQGEGDKPAKSKQTPHRNYNQQRRRGGARQQ